jgi:hypothetical protein
MFDLESIRGIRDRTLAYLHAAVANPAPGNVQAAAAATATFARCLRRWQHAARGKAAADEHARSELLQMQRCVGALAAVLGLATALT